MQTNQKPRIPYWHLWTDADGVSHQTRCFLTEFELQSISRPAQPQWQGHRTRAEVTVMMTVLPEREERFDLLRAVELLAPQHLPLIVVLSDPNLKAAAQFQPSNKPELSSTLVARDLWLGRVELMRDLRARGALVVDSTPEDAGVDSVNAYIDVKRRQML